MMKKFLITIVVILLAFIPGHRAQAQAFIYTWVPPYACTSNMAGFNLVPDQNGYRLIGPIYVPLPGYSAAISNISYSPGLPAYAEATLTLIPPANILNRYALPRLTVVPPLWVDVSFTAAAPLQRLTIDIANPVNRFDTQIVCQLTGTIP